MLSLFINFLLVIEVVVALLIIFIVLMQRPKSEGLGAAFGGGMTENLFGAQTSNVLANATRWLGGIFFLVTLILSILGAKQSMQHSAIQAAAIKAASMATPAPSAAPAASASAPVAQPPQSLQVPTPAVAATPAPKISVAPAIPAPAHVTPSVAAKPASSGTQAK